MTGFEIGDSVLVIDGDGTDVSLIVVVVLSEIVCSVPLGVFAVGSGGDGPGVGGVVLDRAIGPPPTPCWSEFEFANKFKASTKRYVIRISLRRNDNPGAFLRNKYYIGVLFLSLKSSLLLHLNMT